MAGRFIPQINMDAAATPWAKAMQAEVADLREIVDRLSQSTGNSDKSQNATVNVLNRTVRTLEDQVDDFSKRVTYIDTNESFQQFWTSTTADINLGVNLAFALEEAREVLFRGSMTVELNNSATAGAWTQLMTSMAITGVPSGSLPWPTYLGASVQLIREGATLTDILVPLVVEGVVVLPAGSYSIGATGRGDRNGAAPLVDSVFSRPSLSAQILRPV